MWPRQPFYSYCPLHRDSAEILRFAAEICLLMLTTNHFISLSHAETVNENRFSGRHGNGSDGSKYTQLPIQNHGAHITAM